MGRSVLLPICLLGMATMLVFQTQYAFVGTNVQTPTTRALRSSTAKSALPAGVEEIAATSMATALQVSTWGWYANVVCIAVPIIFLITLYLNSEKTKLRDGVEPGNYI